MTTKVTARSVEAECVLRVPAPSARVIPARPLLSTKKEPLFALLSHRAVFTPNRDSLGVFLSRSFPPPFQTLCNWFECLFFNPPVHALIFNSYQYGEMPRDQPHIRLMTISRYPAETTYSITVITSSSLPRVGDRTSLWDTLRLVSHTFLRRT